MIVAATSVAGALTGDAHAVGTPETAPYAAGGISAVPTGRKPFYRPSPALKRRANFRSPYGTCIFPPLRCPCPGIGPVFAGCIIEGV